MLLLASGSPRRAEILASLRVAYVVRAVSVDESVQRGEAPARYLERVVEAKLRAAQQPFAPDAAFDAILVADTSVVIDGDILGKPEGVDGAAAMIARLSGRAHQVMTRFALGGARDGGVLHAETVATRVVFRSLTPAQARAYAETGEGVDKAGAYAIQGLGAALVATIEGSYSNVVGLPACELAVALERLGLWSIGA
jgi:septum formation protein